MKHYDNTSKTEQSAASRHIHLVATPSVTETQKTIEQQIACPVTLIDLTRDPNQNRWLGQELQHTHIHFDNKTPINNLLAIWGCVKGGSHLVISYPQDQSLGRFKSKYLIDYLSIYSEPIENWPSTIDSQYDSQTALYTLLDDSTLNTLAQSINQLVNQETPIIHLIGQRGSGKSTLMGIIIRQLIKQQKSCLLSSPSAASSYNTLQLLPDVSRETFLFITPGKIALYLHQYDVVLIDEAATIARGQLKKITALCAENSNVLMLSTTLEGYEGTGQSHRLNSIKKDNAPVIELSEPKRFSTDDPIYRLSRQLCQPQNKPVNLANGFYCFTQDELAKHQLTESCFSLLRQAHYKTTPNDLARFYDDPACFVVVIREKQIIGAVHAISEMLPTDIASIDIYRGLRRAKNALTHQAIISAYGDDKRISISRAKILRISRIVVDDNFRRAGIAGSMLNQLSEHAKQYDYDLLSTSFSFSQVNYAFWQSQAFLPVRVGVYRNKWNDAYAVLMIKTLKKQWVDKIYKLNHLFCQHVNFYSDYPEALQSSDTKTANQFVITRDTMQSSIDSVIHYHRDIHWLLPELNQYLLQQKDKQNYQLFIKQFNQLVIRKRDIKKARLTIDQLRQKL
ncbi:MAG: hypothetical protein CSA47_01290 [Gammaproteobacteria bacterium]|nr:MAG: hypothetical protein CSA47_01290 [Gammaproteobacteria bacterium]